MDNIANIITFSNEEVVLKIYNHLIEQGYETVEYQHDEESNMYHITCELYEVTDVRRDIVLFIENNLDVELSEDEQREILKVAEKVVDAEIKEADMNKAYVSSKDKYVDVNSSGYSLIIVAILGLALLLIDVTGIYKFPFSGVSRVIFFGTMGVMFVGFMVMGILSLKKAKTLLANADVEKEKEQEIKDFIRNDLNLDSLENGMDSDITDEEKYLIRTAHISAAVKTKYSDAEDSFIEHIVEEVYDEIF